MKILLCFFAVIISILVVLLLVLCIKIGFYGEIIYTKKDGLKFSGKITFLMFSKKINKTKKPKEKSGKKKKHKIEIIPTVKNAACILRELSWVPQKVLYFKKLNLWCKVSLDDPMKNGILYGLISGTLMQAINVLVNHFKTEEYKLRAVPDFVARDGISIKNITWVQFRPLSLIIYLIYAYNKSENLRKSVKYFVNILKKERTEKDEQG